MRRSVSRSAVRVSLALGLTLLMGLPQVLLAADNRDPFQRAVAAQERLNAVILDAPGVVGTGISESAAGRVVIHVYALHGNVAAIPRSTDGVPVRRVVTGLVTARDCNSDPAQRCPRPVPIGVSVGHPSITAGTIGARVRNTAGAVFALSNNHVLANSNNASIGDPALQPGPYDGGTLADSIGTLADFEPIKFGSGQTNVMDAAIAASTTADLGTATPTYGYGKPSTAVATAQPGTKVKKCGRTTKCTEGDVAAVNVTIDVCYKPQGPFFCARNGIARFINQISVTPGTFSAGGDSGSLVVTSSGNQPVGLLFAGSSSHTFANPIGPVLTRFGVTIDDRDDGTAPPTDPPEDPPAADAPQDLTATVRTQGNTRVDLGWTGGAATVDVWRSHNGGADSLIATTNNSGSYRDQLGRGASGTYDYRVCNAGTQACDQTSVTIP